MQGQPVLCLFLKALIFGVLAFPPSTLLIKVGNLNNKQLFYL